jgi:hypothetical protein
MTGKIPRESLKRAKQPPRPASSIPFRRDIQNLAAMFAADSVVLMEE